jgi:hypothetical protein
MRFDFFFKPIIPSKNPYWKKLMRGQKISAYAEKYQVKLSKMILKNQSYALMSVGGCTSPLSNPINHLLRHNPPP